MPKPFLILVAFLAGLNGMLGGFDSGVLCLGGHTCDTAYQDDHAEPDAHDHWAGSHGCEHGLDLLGAHNDADHDAHCACNDVPIPGFVSVVLGHRLPTPEVSDTPDLVSAWVVMYGEASAPVRAPPADGRWFDPGGERTLAAVTSVRLLI